jgi:hypothetical protein
MVPERPPPLLPATLNATAPFPLPELPDVTVIHDALLIAVQLQPAALDTVIGEPAPPAIPINCVAGAIA